MLAPELEAFLLNQITDKRRQLFDDILPHRTKHISVVLENFYQPHNFSAVLRSCDCFGIHDVHIIENDNKYQRNPKINMGSDKWVEIHKHNKEDHNTAACLKALIASGHKIVAAHPHEKQTALQDLDLSQKTAIVFGTEHAGISDVVKEMAHEFMYIPMYGFTESLNVSVAAALTLNSIKNRLLQSNINWQLNETDRANIMEIWLERNVTDYKKLVREWNARNAS